MLVVDGSLHELFPSMHHHYAQQSSVPRPPGPAGRAGDEQDDEQHQQGELPQRGEQDW